MHREQGPECGGDRTTRIPSRVSRPGVVRSVVRVDGFGPTQPDYRGRGVVRMPCVSRGIRTWGTQMDSLDSS